VGVSEYGESASDTTRWGADCRLLLSQPFPLSQFQGFPLRSLRSVPIREIRGSVPFAVFRGGAAASGLAERKTSAFSFAGFSFQLFSPSAFSSSPSAQSVQSVVKLRGLGSDPRSISPRITRISRMQRCSSPATVAKPQRLPAALSSSLFARDASASCAKLAKAQRKAFSLPLLSAKSVQSAVKLRSPFSGLRFSSCALCVPCAA
jgi:hypothetical protein